VVVVLLLVDDKCHFLTFGHGEIGREREKERANGDREGLIFVSVDAFLIFQRVNNCGGQSTRLQRTDHTPKDEKPLCYSLKR
jgi:hypothetical protein